MLDGLITTITEFLLSVFKSAELVTILISMLPIVEARLAIPIAIGYGIEPFFAWLYGFLGSSAIVPVLLLILLPIIRYLQRTKLFKKIGDVVYEKFESRSKGIKTSQESSEQTDQKTKARHDIKVMIGVFIFVAIPMPLTGVWTGSAIAGICGLRYWKSIVAVISGNLVASTIIALLSTFFSAYINTIILIIGLIAIAVVIALILKIIFSKPKNDSATEKDDTLKEDTTK